ncbi:MAG: lysophospholipid transporter LplT [Gallionellaceae bacterium]|nr:lysophospholipid transporter LplT [Gallionellaceae bacterium]
MPRNFYLLLLVQFVSTLADNAFLIIAIARVIELAAADWIVPALKLSFIMFYVLLAPFVGPLSDAIPKGKVMLIANFLKLCAVGLMLFGVDPIVAIGLAGLGAAIYAPAKYGLITELIPAKNLVKANGFFESTTVCAVILGTALGGLLVSPLMNQFSIDVGVWHPNNVVTNLTVGMLGLVILNGLATLLSFSIADSGVRYASHSIHPILLGKRFFSENSILWKDPQGGLSMLVTTLLWGVGATLQLIVLRWGTESLGLPLDQSAYLQGITAVGVVAGAMLASRFVSLSNAVTLLPLGIVLGLLIPAMLIVDSVLWACLLLITVGAVAGYFIVPMNALLQHRGCSLLTAGRSIAVQGFNENAGMLLMLTVYAAGTATQISLTTLIWCFAIMITLGMAAIFLLQKFPRPSDWVTENS